MKKKHWINLSVIDLSSEEWRNIEGFEGVYQVSNLGRVKSLSRAVPNQTSIPIRKTQIMKQRFNANGYLCVRIQVNKKTKGKSVHRLVAQAFIPNPQNKPFVNHKCGIKADNRVSELEWVTNQENTIHSYRLGLQKPNRHLLGHKGSSCHNSIPVTQYTLDGAFVKNWDCQADVKRALNINQAHISDCCRGKRNTVRGFIWKYTNDPNKASERISKTIQELVESLPSLTKRRRYRTRQMIKNLSLRLPTIESNKYLYKY